MILLSDDRNISNKKNIINVVAKQLKIPKDEAKKLVDISPSVLGENLSENDAVILKRGIEINKGKVKVLIKSNNEYFDAQLNASENRPNPSNTNKISSMGSSQRENNIASQGYKSFGSGETASYKSSSSVDNEIPSFSAPKSGNNDSPPVFNAPVEGDNSDAPVFHAPAGEGDSGAPVFHAPQDGVNSGVPVFSAPTGGGGSGAPVFNAPNTSIVNSGNCCSYHPHNRAVARCDNCGKPICQECKDAGELTDGSHWCFDCASSLVQSDIDLAKEKRASVSRRITIGVIGAIIMAVLSFTGPGKAFLSSGGSNEEDVMMMRVLFIMFGASLSVFWPILRRLLSWMWRFFRWRPLRSEGIVWVIFTTIKIMVLIFAFVAFISVFGFFLMIAPVVAIVLAIIDFVRYKKANDLVIRNQEILQHLSDRMEYIRIQSEENLDYNTLANDVRMQNNHFAQAVMREGYEGANRTFANEAREMAENDQNIKKAFTRNEFGELVRAA